MKSVNAIAFGLTRTSGIISRETAAAPPAAGPIRRHHQEGGAQHEKVAAIHLELRPTNQTFIPFHPSTS